MAKLPDHLERGRVPWKSRREHAAAPATTALPFDPAWHGVVGKYRGPLADAQILVMDDRLVLINPTDANPEGSLYDLIPVGENQFRLEGKDGNGPVGEPAVFELGPDGKVARLKIGENYLYPHTEY